jgi:ankyrin repeat protein
LSEQDFHIAAIYLKKLARSGISRQELIDLLGARDANGVTALEAAMVKGRSQNVADFLDLIINACEFNPIQSDELREARNGTERLGLFGAIENGGKGVGDAIRAYFKTFEEGGDKKKLLELLMTQDNAGSTGVSALRFALLRDKAEAVEALLRVILESQLLSPDEKQALLLEGEKDVQGVVLSEYVQAQFFDMVLKAYQKAFPKKAIPMEYMGPFSMRERDLTQAELNEIQSIAKTRSGESQQAIKLANMREASWMAMLKKLPATERAKLEEGKRLLHPTAISKTLPAFHAALINGCKEAVGSYIKTVADCAAGADGINPVELILAKKDGGKGNPAFFDAMQGNENGAIAAYIDAVLSSKLKSRKDEDQKRELLLARDKHGMSAFQCAMGSGASRAANAYLSAVLSSSRIEDSYKVDLLHARGTNIHKKGGAAGEGSSGGMETARDTALCPSDAKPQPHLQLVREFDEAIRRSNQLSEQSKALLTQFDKLMGNAKT